MYTIRAPFRVMLVLCAIALSFWRAVNVYDRLRHADPAPLLAFPLTVLFPALLVILLSQMPAARSREGILMRIGTMLQLCLIIMLPSLALYLALGLPVVFLVVEVFETRLPKNIREPLIRLAVA